MVAIIYLITTQNDETSGIGLASSSVLIRQIATLAAKGQEMEREHEKEFIKEVHQKSSTDIVISDVSSLFCCTVLLV